MVETEQGRGDTMREKAEHSTRLLLRALWLIAALAGAGGLQAVVAAPLEKEACDALKSEQAVLSLAGARADLARGAAWGKANLGADRLKKIARLIEVDEQVMFRCPAPPPEVDAAAKPQPAASPKPKQAKPAAAEAGRNAKATAGGKAETGAATAASGGKLEPQAATAPEKPQKPSKAAAAAAEKKRAAAAAARQKIKPDDAFVPPPDAPMSTLQPPPAGGSPKPQ